ncbi:MAG TPA: hypothetical protein PLM07_16715 [Candidatus Rifleibacterium sp.]|nr:hypothetical protein [Candidatus Rifleibacterium sp.]HPT47527.1 hypothetical protein [Candidatus Rifleibacterium sp.]
MNELIDVVNFNSDASCLRSEDWITAISGGKSAYFYQWLQLYVSRQKKISLGLTGASVADIAYFNPEAIELLQNHLDIFEIVLRPFAHDLAVLRLPEGFLLNFHLGRKILNKHFTKVTDFYLPPEFMLTSEQIWLLKNEGVKGTFVQSGRLDIQFSERIPSQPYHVKGINESSLQCIPFNRNLTLAYLKSLALYNAEEWNNILSEKSPRTFFSWRDGESFLLFPNGLEREKNWLDRESKSIERSKLNENNMPFAPSDSFPHPFFQTYPPHPLSGWLRELKLMGFLNRISNIEKLASEFEDWQLVLWLELIKSDIFSSVEKQSPNIQILENVHDKATKLYTIHRSEKVLEAEEILYLLTSVPKVEIESLLSSHKCAFAKKIIARRQAIRSMLK